MLSAERLQLGLLIGADDVLVRVQALAFEGARVEIKCAPSLLGEVGVAREDPRPGLPRLDRVPPLSLPIARKICGRVY
jgi:hypothetical protein